MEWEWSEVLRGVPVLKSDTMHTCRDWGRLKKWAEARAIDSDQKRLKFLMGHFPEG
jgi:hypothetical protein